MSNVLRHPLKTCTECKGSGACKHCANWTETDDIWRTCQCKGSLECSVCNGEGRVPDIQRRGG